MSSLLAIDPGSNKLGLAFFMNGELVGTRTLTTSETEPLKRRLDIANQLAEYIDLFDSVASEEPLLLGRNNNAMQRMLGVIEHLTKGKVIFCHPMTLKAFTGSGSNDKLDMALAIGEMLNKDSEKELLAKAITEEAFDETDAVAVGLWALDKNRSTAL